MYLTQSAISDNPYMKQRVAQCAAQQNITDAQIDPDTWASEWRRMWASSPGWDDAWESALANPEKPPGYDPGMDAACITDQQILAQVQVMMPFHRLAEAPAP